MSRNTGGPLSAELWNSLRKDLLAWADELRDRLLREFHASGHPPGTVKLEPRDIYERLIALRDAGDPMYTRNPNAQRELVRLAKRFGEPPPRPLPGAAPQLETQ